MRWFFVSLAVVCFSSVLFGSVFVSAADLETATVSVEEDPLSDPQISEEGQSSNNVDSVDPAAVDDPAVYAAPSEADSFSGLAFYSLSTNLGDITLYLPNGLSGDTFKLDGSSLINMSNSSVYLYCPEFPNYTFSASRFSGVTYRSSGYDSTDLVVSDITTSYSFDDFVPVVTVFAFALIIFFLVRGLF